VATDLPAGGLRLEARVMGTVCAAEAFPPPGMGRDRLRAALHGALDEVARWDDILSDWRDDTPLSRLSRAPVGVDVDVPDTLRPWLADAFRWRECTGGAFDPTVGALVDAWGLRHACPARPTSAALAAALRACGPGALAFLGDGTALRRLDPAARLDPGASGKGWALDRAAGILRRAGVDRALLSFRSTLLALGPPPGGDGWPVPVAHDGGDTVIAHLELVQEALSVSGGSLRAFQDGDVLRGAVLDPATGVPLPAARLAWVRHPSASASDALATALLVRGPDLPPVDGARGAWLAAPDAVAVPWPAHP
jgi:thiamine biosynthesis lipoprotein